MAGVFWLCVLDIGQSSVSAVRGKSEEHNVWWRVVWRMVCDLADRISGSDCGCFGMCRFGCVCRVKGSGRSGDGRIAVHLLPLFPVALPGAGAVIAEPGIFEDHSRDAE